MKRRCLAAFVALIVGAIGATGSAAADDPGVDPYDDAGAPRSPTDEGRSGASSRAAAIVIRDIAYPVDGPVTTVPAPGDFGACRAGCSRSHEGNDLVGRKSQRLLSAVDGTVTRIEADATPNGTEGNYVVITDAAGWRYVYIHVNNDSPGTDDGANPAEWRVAPGIAVGTTVKAGQHIAYMGDSGNAEATVTHLHFEIRDPSGYWGEAVDPYPSLARARRIRPNPRFLLRAWAGSGHATHDVGFGTTGESALLCDFDGDGTDSPALVDGARWAIKTDLGPGGPDVIANYGRVGDLPLCGDWDGDGVDTIGLRRGRVFHLRNSNSGGPADITLTYGFPTDTAVVGDWDGNGTDTFGVRRGHDFMLRNRNSSGVADITLSYGIPSDTPIVGDFDGDGRDTMGVRRGAEYYLRNSLRSGNADVVYRYGVASDVAVMGDLVGDRVDSPGVFRP